MMSFDKRVNFGWWFWQRRPRNLSPEFGVVLAGSEGVGCVSIDR